MINIHIFGDGTLLYAIKSILEVNARQFNDDIQVTCFGSHYTNPLFVLPMKNHVTVDDAVKRADLVVCINPELEEEIVELVLKYNKPSLYTFKLQDSSVYNGGIFIDNLNVLGAAVDLWVNRLIDTVDNITEIEHFTGLSKYFDTGDNALPGISIEDYRAAIESVTGQPKLINLINRYFYSSEISKYTKNGIEITNNWIIDTDKIDAKKLDITTNFLYHTTYKTKEDNGIISVHHSHMECANQRSLAAWYYINSCVVSSFIYMWEKDLIPQNCNDYNVIDHSTFSDNIFGARFRIA
jgi:hypothetical protein